MLTLSTANIIQNYCLANERLKAWPDSPIRIIGNGPGDKIGNLLEKGRDILNNNFALNRIITLGDFPIRLVLEDRGLDFFSLARGKTVLPPEELEALLIDSKILRHHLDHISRLVGNSQFVAVRSSGLGDQAGKGQYKTIYCQNNSQNLQRAVALVVSSYLTPSKTHFREKAGLSPCLGVGIEPLLGSWQKDAEGEIFFAPLLSGMGVAFPDDQSYFYFTRGFGDQIVHVSDKSKIVSEVRHGKLFLDLTEEPKEIMSKLTGKEIGLVRAIVPKATDGEESEPVEVLADLGSYESVRFADIFSNLRGLACSVGKPQYFEFAVVNSRPQAKWFITQISDHVPDSPFHLPQIKANTFASGEEVNKSGIVKASRIIRFNPDDGSGSPMAFVRQLDNLAIYNQSNNDYILVFYSHILRRYGKCKIELDHFSNARGALIVSSFEHNSPVFFHLKGATRSTNIMLCVSEVEPNWNLISDKQRSIAPGLTEYDYPLEIHANNSNEGRRGWVANLP